MTVILILALILIIITAVLFSSVEVVVAYEEKKLRCEVYLNKIRIFKLKGGGKSAGKVLSKPEKFPGLYKSCINLLGKYVQVKSIVLNITVGTSDAATTAIGVGALWAAVYSLIGIVASIVTVDKHNVNIVPDYVNAVFSLNGKCIIRSRVVYIIIIVLTILMKINPKKGKEE